MKSQYLLHWLIGIFITLGALSSTPEASAQAQPVMESHLWSVDDSVCTLRSICGTHTVIVFFSETCPICQKYTPTLRSLEQKYVKKGVRFVLVFPDTMTTTRDLKIFAKKFKVSTRLMVDRRQELSTALNARTTPEAALLNTDGDLLYMGRIDNLFVEPGKMRSIVTERELEKALDAVVAGKLPEKRQEPAVGCLIERRRN